MSEPSSRCLPLLRHPLVFSLFLVVLVSASAFRPSRTLSMEMLQFRTGIVEFAQQFVGLRYRYAGKSPETGFDCSGFTSFILKKFDTEVSCSSSLQSTQGVKIPLTEVEPGDLLFFGRKGRIQHVAMVVEHNANGIVCIHSTCSRGIIVENVSTSSYWRSRILFARDVLGRKLFDEATAQTIF